MHLFFAYLRSLSPGTVKGLNGISSLPMSLQKLVQETEYPPQTPELLQIRTAKVSMIVESVSPTPFALLRRANHFQYRDQDRVLQVLSEYEDPIQALTDECRRVLNSISGANESKLPTTNTSNSPRTATWSRFEDFGFSGTFDDDDEIDKKPRKSPPILRTTPGSRTMDMGRPTTPSWADFLSSGFVDEASSGPAPLLLPPDKILPPIETSRGRSSQSHMPKSDRDLNLDPGELASITNFDLDDAFWWVWISSLAAEEPADRKAAFGRCALVETVIPDGKWLVMEEIVRGAAPEPVEGAYIAEKKSRFGWTKRSKDSRRRSTGKSDSEKHSNTLPPGFRTAQSTVTSKTSIGPDQHARIQAAAAQLQQKQLQQEMSQSGSRRGRNDPDAHSRKTNSVFTLQPVILSEASPAMKWAHKYDKDAIREAYLSNSETGKGITQAAMGQQQNNGSLATQTSSHTNGGTYLNYSSMGGATPTRRDPSPDNRSLPKLPQEPGDVQQEVRPAVPAKTATPPTPPQPEIVQPPPAVVVASPAPLPPSSPRNEDVEAIPLSEKAAEVELPADPHPIERKPVPAQIAPSTSTSFDAAPVEQREASTDLGSDYGNRGRNPKLQKKATGGGGFRKMFGRNKNRQSTLPESSNGGIKLQPGQLQPGGATLGRRFSGFRKKSMSQSPTENTHPALSQTQASMNDDNIAPVQYPEQNQLRSYEPSAHTSISRVNTNEAHEAHQAFSSFDQGPLDDVPAFVPESPLNGKFHSEPDEPEMSAPTTAESSNGPELTKQVSPVQDRWAQIRRNAADRATHRQSEEQSRTGHSITTDNDGDTSGEETIESRVARIKQRVAELTGNMESVSSGPNGPTRKS